jgi:hypothetical protein
VHSYGSLEQHTGVREAAVRKDQKENIVLLGCSDGWLSGCGCCPEFERGRKRRRGQRIAFLNDTRMCVFCILLSFAMAAAGCGWRCRLSVWHCAAAAAWLPLGRLTFEWTMHCCPAQRQREQRWAGIQISSHVTSRHDGPCSRRGHAAATAQLASAGPRTDGQYAQACNQSHCARPADGM